MPSEGTVAANDLERHLENFVVRPHELRIAGCTFPAHFVAACAIASATDAVVARSFAAEPTLSAWVKADVAFPGPCSPPGAEASEAGWAASGWTDAADEFVAWWASYTAAIPAGIPVAVASWFAAVVAT